MSDPTRRSRLFRLIALVVVVVLMWLVVQCWGKCYDSVLEHCLGVKEEHTRYHVLMAILATVLVFVVVFALDVDDLL